MIDEARFLGRGVWSKRHAAPRSDGDRKGQNWEGKVRSGQNSFRPASCNQCAKRSEMVHVEWDDEMPGNTPMEDDTAPSVVRTEKPISPASSVSEQHPHRSIVMNRANEAGVILLSLLAHSASNVTHLAMVSMGETCQGGKGTILIRRKSAEPPWSADSHT